ncbi:uncharacterized protein LOC105211087 isoform X1 [Zeugodacus cucurbitae]|uniref:uncharacterized protein LOC105211087 isoform X1 n=1 Tax=Zeugodacus cucurbitae TaxID=28588 RepID=UPI0010A73F52|nr:uncharacterized protein LOC105211087 isoform X1 [Zeugodacus cucurbitae]
MYTRNMYQWLVLLSLVSLANCSWSNRVIEDFINSFSNVAEDDECDQPEMCDEMQVMLHLACIRATSPERILLLLTREPLSKVCAKTSNVVQHINETLTDCVPLPTTNLYMRLYRAVIFFYGQMCGPADTKSKHLEKYHNCITELRDDLIDCEGPADWFEKRSKTYVCRQFTEIINCDYIRAALLCGLKPARLLRSFAAEVINKALLSKCPVSSSLPHVNNPMSDGGSRSFPHVSPVQVYIFLLAFMLQCFMQ